MVPIRSQVAPGAHHACRRRARPRWAPRHRVAHAAV